MNYLLVFSVGVVTVIVMAFVVTGLAHFVGPEGAILILILAVIAGIAMVAIEYTTEGE